MGTNYTDFQFQLFDCPREQVGVFFDLIDDLDLSEDWEPRWAVEPLPRIHFGTEYAAHEVPVGSVAEWVERLTEEAPGATWRMWEDPCVDVLGDLACHVPGLGLWRGDCDAHGRPVFTATEIRAMVGTRDFERLLGTPWLDAVDEAADALPDPRVLRVFRDRPDADNAEGDGDRFEVVLREEITYRATMTRDELSTLVGSPGNLPDAALVAQVSADLGAGGQVYDWMRDHFALATDREQREVQRVAGGGES